MSVLRAIGNAAVDLLYPPRCLTCGALDEPFCPVCRASIQPVPAGVALPAAIRDARSVGYHEGPLRDAVLKLKFERKTALSTPLGELMAEALEEAAAGWRPDVLIPVPLHWTRRVERGFNQSELLAATVMGRLGLPLHFALRRIRPTTPQVGQTRGQRAGNLKGAFQLDPRQAVTGMRVVVLDDVRTTGATLGECARVLREAGAEEVFALTVTWVP